MSASVRLPSGAGLQSCHAFNPCGSDANRGRRRRFPRRGQRPQPRLVPANRRWNGPRRENGDTFCSAGGRRSSTVRRRCSDVCCRQVASRVVAAARGFRDLDALCPGLIRWINQDSDGRTTETGPQTQAVLTMIPTAAAGSINEPAATCVAHTDTPACGRVSYGIGEPVLIASSECIHPVQLAEWHINWTKCKTLKV